MKTRIVSKPSRFALSILLAAVLLLTACNLPILQPDLSPTVDFVATEVATQRTPLPSDTPAPTATLPPQPTVNPEPDPEPATPTPTLSPDDPVLTLGQPSWQDNLSSTRNFYLYENDNTKIEDEDGVIELTGRNANGWLGWTLTYAQQPANFYLEATFRVHECSGGDLYGIIFRAGEESTGYFFAVTCDGRYNLYARDFENDINAELIGFTAAPGLVSGSNQVNRLGVMAQGNRLALYANGVYIGETSDSTYSQGYFGAFIAANRTRDFTVDLDHIKLWNLNP